MDNAMTTVSRSTHGWINGFIGVLIFSGSLPATKAGITGFAPDFLTTARAAIAGIAALLILAVLRQRLPAAKYLLSLIVVAAGVVVGFPLLTALALQYVSSAHSIVYLGLLPLATALFGSCAAMSVRAWRSGFFLSSAACL